MEEDLIILNIILQKTVSLPLEAKQYLFKQLQQIEIKKKQLLLRDGSICQNLYLIESGLNID